MYKEWLGKHYTINVLSEQKASLVKCKHRHCLSYTSVFKFLILVLISRQTMYPAMIACICSCFQVQIKTAFDFKKSSLVDNCNYACNKRLHYMFYLQWSTQRLLLIMIIIIFVYHSHLQTVEWLLVWMEDQKSL